MAATPMYDPTRGESMWAANDHDTTESLLAIYSDRDGLSLPDSAASFVLGVDIDALSQEARLAAIAVADRAMAAMAAKQAALMVKVAMVERAEQDALDAQCPPLLGQRVDDPERELIAQALCVSPRSASARVSQAWALCHDMPEVWWAQRAGRLGSTSARTLVDTTLNLPNDCAREVAREVMCAGFSATPGSVRRRAERLAARRDPRGTHERHEEAKSQRRVFIQPEGDGMASLWWLADAATIGQVRDLIDGAVGTVSTARARLDSTSDEGIDAARSDALAALLLTERTSANPRRPVVAVHVGLPTLLGLADEAAEVPGLGYLPAHQARQLAATGDWRVFLHSADGRLAAIGTKAYTPTAAMTALVVARDRTCQFPGCAQPAHRCDIDHIEPYNHQNPAAGGQTHIDNLQALCRRHHNLKTNGVWRITQNRDRTTWTGPRGQHAQIEHDPDPP